MSFAIDGKIIEECSQKAKSLLNQTCLARQAGISCLTVTYVFVDIVPTCTAVQTWRTDAMIGFCSYRKLNIE